MRDPNNTSNLRLNSVASAYEEGALGRPSSQQIAANASSRSADGALYGFTLAIALLMLVLPILVMSNDVAPR